MRLTFALIILFSLQSWATGFSQTKVTLDLKSASFKKVIAELEKKTIYRFVFSERHIPENKFITMSVNNKEVLEVLGQVLEGTSFSFQRLQGNLIAIVPVGTLMKDITVTGKVLDETNMPIPGATITIKGLSRGTQTDTNGNYSLIAPENAVLIVSYIGYDPQEIQLDSRTTLNIKLVPSSQKLNEVVVVGYGTQRRADLTGSIASVNANTIARAATTDATGALQGNTPGVTVVKRVGKPGSGFAINIRGISSFGGNNSPLFVIDGVPTTSGLNDLNPADIEKIDVLKDASATAIYGSRGAKGVVIVTTKRGKSGKTVISYDAYMGVRTPANLPDMMSGPEYVAYMMQLYKNTGRSTDRSNTSFFTANEWENIDAGNYTDWSSMFITNGLQMNHNVSVSGGDEKTKFSFGGGYLQEQGNVSPEDFKRYSIRVNIEHQISKKWRAGMNFYGAQNLQNEGSAETLRSSYRIHPVASAVNSNGDRIERPLANSQGLVHPYFDQENEIRRNRWVRSFGQLFLQVEPIEYLTLKTSFSPGIYSERRGWYRGLPSKNALDNQAVSHAESRTNEQFTWIWDNQVTYARTFGEHKITATAIQSAQKDREEWNQLDGVNLPFRSLWYNLGSAKNTLPNGTLRAPVNVTGFRKITLASARGRLNYTFKDKYLFTASGTWDGSSRLAEGNQWAFFPSAAFAWRLSEEPFIKKITAINDLKLRLSYGESGNDRVDPYSTQATLASTVYYFGNTLAQGYAPGLLANKNLGWETTKEINLGLDYTMFDNRVSGTVDVYNRTITDVLLNRNLPAPVGYGSVLANIGKLRNRGIEVGLSTTNIQSGKFSWKTDFVFDANKNVILETGNGKNDDIGNRWFIGQPIQVNYDYKFDGIWQLDQAEAAAAFGQKPGMVRVLDISGPNGVPDGVINEADRTIIGKRAPSWTGSFANTFRYGNVDLYIMAYTRQGEQFLSQFHQTFASYSSQWINQARGDYWTPENPSNTFPAPGGTAAAGNFAGAANYRTGNFVRISNITLGYTFASKVLQKLNLNNLRVYATATNPFLFSKFDGYDPEWSSDNVYGGAISSSTYMFGLNLGF
ncbi:TonB-linked SusC/RagA family outer membrane protein [Pedobacter sp. CAN_A7]|uniref:TonB-dependent receptor n=1 Tax=Pedobacter sp. CAN_A7 TaxID=2787722 RepID=UPI0018C8FA7A